MLRADLTWTCHACGDVRPDSEIAVFSRVHPIERSGATMSENIRFCADRPACEERAQHISLLGQPGMEKPANWGADEPRALADEPALSLRERIKNRWFSR